MEKVLDTEMNSIPFATVLSDFPETQLRSVPIKWNRPETTPYSFEDLAAKVESLSAASLAKVDWKTLVDREHSLALFYRLDTRGDIPKLSKCLRIRSEGNEDFRLVPGVFLDEEQRPEGVQVPYLITSPEICSFEDVTRLLKVLNLYPDIPDLSKEMDMPGSSRESEAQMAGNAEAMGENGIRQAGVDPQLGQVCERAVEARRKLANAITRAQARVELLTPVRDGAVDPKQNGHVPGTSAEGDSARQGQGASGFAARKDPVRCSMKPGPRKRPHKTDDIQTHDSLLYPNCVFWSRAAVLQYRAKREVLVRPVKNLGLAGGHTHRRPLSPEDGARGPLFLPNIGNALFFGPRPSEAVRQDNNTAAGRGARGLQPSTYFAADVSKGSDPK